ncbi:MAG TPA: hypothetical protein VLA49_17645 [Anaerolineales bacterium]|nr:hypothetical protein [Anaerolineales bacterium]
MNESVNVPDSATKKEAKEQTSRQLELYLERQSDSRRALHRWMTRLEVASLGIAAAALIMAVYVSIAWKSTPGNLIAVAWFVFIASGMPFIMLVGLHAIILRAFPPIGVPGLSLSQKFLTGAEAVWAGLGYIGLGLAIGAFWGLFAYAVGTVNLDLVETLVNILGVVLAAGIGIGILSKLYRQVTKSL